MRLVFPTCHVAEDASDIRRNPELFKSTVGPCDNNVVDIVADAVERRYAHYRVCGHLRDHTASFDSHGGRLPVHLVHGSVSQPDRYDVTFPVTVIAAGHRNDRSGKESRRQIAVTFDAHSIGLPIYLVQYPRARSDDHQVTLLVAVVECGHADNRPWRERHRQVVMAFDANSVRLPEDLVHVTSAGADDSDVPLLGAIVQSRDPDYGV